MNKTSGTKPPKAQPAERPTLISNTVRSWLLSRPLSEAARTAVESAKWRDDRQCWALSVPSLDVLTELGAVCTSPGTED